MMDRVAVRHWLVWKGVDFAVEGGRILRREQLLAVGWWLVKKVNFAGGPRLC